MTNQKEAFSITRENLDFYRMILRASYNEAIDLRIISPVHAWHLERMCNKYKLENIEKWKRLMVQINEEEAKTANVSPFPFGISAVTIGLTLNRFL